MHLNQFVAVIFLVLVLATSPVSSGTFTQYSGGKKGSCKTEAVAFRRILPSLVSCAFLCQSRKECRNINFNEETQTCVGCRHSCDATNSPGNSSEGQCWKRGQFASDCLDHANRFNATEENVYSVRTDNNNEYDVFCLKFNFSKQPEWTVIMRRKDKTLSFNRTFRDYEDGFGDVRDDHWRGLRFLHEMTTNTSSEVLVIFDVQGSPYIGEGRQSFSDFMVGPAPGYRLSVGGEVIDTGEWETDTCLGDSNKSNFSTMDRDIPGSFCSSKHGYGGWWWNEACLSSNPTGLYDTTGWTEKMHNLFEERCLNFTNVNKLTMAFRRRQ